MHPIYGVLAECATKSGAKIWWRISSEERVYRAPNFHVTVRVNCCSVVRYIFSSGRNTVFAVVFVNAVSVLYALKINFIGNLSLLFGPRCTWASCCFFSSRDSVCSGSSWPFFWLQLFLYLLQRFVISKCRVRERDQGTRHLIIKRPKRSRPQTLVFGKNAPPYFLSLAWWLISPGEHCSCRPRFMQLIGWAKW